MIVKWAQEDVETLYNLLIKKNLSFVTSYWLCYRINVTHSAERPQARKSSGGKGKTIVVR